MVCLSPFTLPGVAPELSENAGNQISIANTHLFWNPEFEYLKLRQAQMFLHRAAQVSTSCASCAPIASAKPTICDDARLPIPALPHPRSLISPENPNPHLLSHPLPLAT